MKPFVAFLCLPALLSSLASAQPAVTAVVNGASFQPALAPGCLISIFGTSLASELASAASLPLPVQLGSTSASIDGVDIPLYFVSPGQINAQIPFGITQRSAALVVRTASGTSQPYSLSILPAAPGIFTYSQDGKASALAFDAGFHDLTRVGDDAFILFATGLGATNPPATAGNPGAGAEPLNRIANPVAIAIGGQPATVEYAGLAPGFAGVYQINVRAAAVRANNLLAITVRGSQSNVVALPVPAGTIEASGTIAPLYPVASITPLGYSPLLTAGRFEIHVTVPADGATHTVNAVAEGGQALLLFKPDGTYEASLTVPTAAAGHLDFSSSDFTPLDFSANGLPFAGGVLPLARIDTEMLRTLQLLPMANQSTPGLRANGALTVSGSYIPGQPFVIDQQTHGELSTFGGFINLPVPVVNHRATTFILFADGRQIASETVDFPVVVVSR